MFTVRLITLQDELYTGPALEVVLPIMGGQVTIMDLHQPIVSRLTAGIIRIDKQKFFRIKDGIIKMSGVELIGIVEL